jgi:hypothetical protein
MEMQIKGVFNVISLCVRYTQDGETYEAMVFFNVEEGKLIHNIEVPPEFKAGFESRIIEMFGPLRPNAENLPRFDDYVTPDLQGQINAARQGNAEAFDERIAGIRNFANREQE